MRILIIIIAISLISCKLKNQDTALIKNDQLTNIKNEEIVKPQDNSLETKFFLIDSLLEINFRKFKNYKGEYETTGINIIDHKTNRWIFDSEGPQIESNSDITKINDSLYTISVYYDFPTSIDTVTMTIKVAKFDLRLFSSSKKYSFLKDTLFSVEQKPFKQRDIEKTLADYFKLIEIKYIYEDTQENQKMIWNMINVSERLLSSYVSGCDSCQAYFLGLTEKYEAGLFASDSDIIGEYSSVFKILNKK